MLFDRNNPFKPMDRLELEELAQHLSRNNQPAPPEFTFDVAIIGLGYVGLPTALGFREAGCTVVGIDSSPERLIDIHALDVDLIPEDRERLADQAGCDELLMSLRPEMMSLAEAILICVPTPVTAWHEPDLTYLRAACEQVVANAREGQVIILTSTSYVGTTTELLITPLQQKGFAVGRDLHVAFSPERIDPGNRGHRQRDIPRVVGGATMECAQAAAKVLTGTASKIEVVSSTGAAEMAKLWENTFRAVNIAFANEMSDLCSDLGLNVMEVVQAAATKPYGFMPFFPGPGVGGHCIPCDPHYLLDRVAFPEKVAPVVSSAMKAIAARPIAVVDRALDMLNAMERRGLRVLISGVAYKGGVADVRDSPALAIITGLRDERIAVDYYDPFVETLTIAGEEMTGITQVQEQYDLVIVHTAHPIDMGWVRTQPLVLDCTYRLPAAPNSQVL